MGIKTPRPAGQPAPLNTCDWIVTTTYQNLGKLVKQGCTSYTPVRTTRGVPRFPLPYSAGVAQCVMPEARMMGMSEAMFRGTYRAHLSNIGIDTIRDELERHYDLSGEKPLALLCFCKTHTGEHAFCHRHIFAEWWKDQTGEQIVELAQA
jgi:hypothetical protein